MTTVIICIAIFIAAVFWYRNDIIKNVDEEIYEGEFFKWKSFILAQIRSCETQEHCMGCYELIRLMDKKFRGMVDKNLFEHTMHQLWEDANEVFSVITEPISILDVNPAMN